MNLDYLTNLNENQEEAVLHLNGPLLIVAGAGSGKTRVLTARIAHIVKQHKAFPNQVLAVTFTNKAAKEMQLRVSKFLRKEATGLPWLGTFHSISAKILRKHAEAAGLKSNFSIDILPGYISIVFGMKIFIFLETDFTFFISLSISFG